MFFDEELDGSLVSWLERNCSKTNTVMREALVTITAEQIAKQNIFNDALMADDPCAALVSRGYCRSLKGAQIVVEQARLVWLINDLSIEQDHYQQAEVEPGLIEHDGDWDMFDIWSLVTLHYGRLPMARNG